MRIHCAIDFVIFWSLLILKICKYCYSQSAKEKKIFLNLYLKEFIVNNVKKKSDQVSDKFFEGC